MDNGIKIQTILSLFNLSLIRIWTLMLKILYVLDDTSVVTTKKDLVFSALRM